jgi:hypothetical protein
MMILTQAQADRIHAQTATVVANMRAEADMAEANGNPIGAQTLRRFADSRERAGMRAHAGARVGRA